MSNCFLKTHWYTFKSYILNLILSVILQFTNLILNKKFVKPGLNYGNYLTNSGIFPNKNKNYYRDEGKNGQTRESNRRIFLMILKENGLK